MVVINGLGSNQYYKSAVNNELSSVLLSKKITTDEIKKSNYQITSSSKRFRR